MTPRELYEKYEHLDHLLADKQLLPDDLMGQILYELWQVVKAQTEHSDMCIGGERGPCNCGKDSTR